MAGYSKTPLYRKLGIKPGHTVALVGKPSGWEIEGLPEGVTVISPDRKVGLVNQAASSELHLEPVSPGELVDIAVHNAEPRFKEEGRILSIRVMRGDWPAQRSIAGLDLPRETSLDNLWNVGDGVREYANGGVQACAESAKLAVEQILERFGTPVTPRP